MGAISLEIKLWVVAILACIAVLMLMSLWDQLRRYRRAIAKDLFLPIRCQISSPDPLGDVTSVTAECRILQIGSSQIELMVMSPVERGSKIEMDFGSLPHGLGAQFAQSIQGTVQSLKASKAIDHDKPVSIATVSVECSRLIADLIQDLTFHQPGVQQAEA